MTLADLFYETAQLNGDKIAIWCEGESITYKELAKLTSQYANFLLENEVVYGEHIGIPMYNNIISVALMLAAANNGITLVPINPTLPEAAIIQAFEASDVKHIIANARFFEKNKNLYLQGRSFCLDAYMEGKTSLLNVDQQSSLRPYNEKVNGKETFIITLTSGSTGTPKPILLTQENKNKRIVAHYDLYKVTKKDRVLAATPLYHSLAERLVLMPLLIGGTCILMARFTPTRWLKIVKEQQVTFTIAVSAQLTQINHHLMEVPQEDMNSLRCLVSSSALLEGNVRKELIERLQCDFYEMYGTSETSTVTSINFKESLSKQNSVGKPLKDATIKIINDDFKETKTYEIGEIACRTLLMCEGYYKKMDLFEESVAGGYFKTGDLGYVDEDGYLYFAGRKKELIITGGINVYPTDVDKVISSLPEIEECASFSYPDEKLGEVVAVAIVLKKDNELSARDIQRYCSKKLADYQQPQKIFFVKDLPKNAMGKLLRTQIINHITE
ncbi:class I adenylate-forming enzyme family protein [Lysinibacillus capsici]|uniref:class I adenylate-forming enzyme family protein n=1 Tax=Lysinibacillus capsici TaxID=2115968 RepID=UPI001C11ABF7|nr:class I adenylate-forming enzyme family protein [Lysinibacillus capsici]MBU5253543.1 acyl--CoA ligase [Lysinibacillus capsici]